MTVQHPERKFNLFFAGASHGGDEYMLERGALKLFSYANDKKAIDKYMADERRGAVLVDSGAYSVAHSGKHVDIDEYIAWINARPQLEYFIALDVIPYPDYSKIRVKECAKESWDNYMYMLERVNEPKKIVPVYHYGEDHKWLKRMIEHQYEDGTYTDFICISRKHGVSMEKQEEYFEKIFTTIHASKNPDVKVHVLGMTALKTLEKFPFFSADSTTHIIQAAYGLMFSPYGPLNVSSSNKKADNLIYMDQEIQDEIEAIAKDLGYSIEDIKSDTATRMRYNVDYTLRWSENYEYKGPKRFKSRGLF